MARNAVPRIPVRRQPARPTTPTPNPYRDMPEAEKNVRLGRLASALRNKFDDVKASFKTFDLDGDGDVTKEEFRAVLEDVCVLGVDDDDIDLMVEETDTDRNGIIELEEFVRMMSRLRDDVEGDIKLMIEAKYSSTEEVYSVWSEQSAVLTQAQAIRGLKNIGLDLTDFQCLFFARKLAGGASGGIPLSKFQEVFGTFRREPKQPLAKRRARASTFAAVPTSTASSSAAARSAAPTRSASPPPARRGPAAHMAPPAAASFARPRPPMARRGSEPALRVPAPPRPQQHRPEDKENNFARPVLHRQPVAARRMLRAN